MSVANQPVITCNHHVLTGGDRCPERFGGDRVETPKQLRTRAVRVGWTKTYTPWMTEIDLCPIHTEDDPRTATPRENGTNGQSR